LTNSLVEPMTKKLIHSNPSDLSTDVYRHFLKRKTSEQNIVSNVACHVPIEMVGVYIIAEIDDH
jgi:hypothetical protein